MAIGLAVLIILVMFWRYDDPAPAPTSSPALPVVPMNETPPMLAGPPTITYRITRWDLFVNHMTIILRNRILQIVVFALAVWDLWMDLRRYVEYASPLELGIRGLSILTAFGGFLIGTLIVIGFLMSFLLKQRGVVCEHVLEITDEGLIESTEMNRTVHKWSAVGRIMNIFGYLYVYVGDQISHQIPRRDIPVEKMAVFENELRARAAAAR